MQIAIFNLTLPMLNIFLKRLALEMEPIAYRGILGRRGPFLQSFEKKRYNFVILYVNCVKSIGISLRV